MKSLCLFVCFSIIGLSTQTSRSQSICDSIEIVSIQYPLLTDTLLYVAVENNSTQIFNYPSFILLDQASDTIAIEQVNFFGIGQQQIHRLTPVAANISNDYSQAKLELWTGFFDSLACTFTQDIHLCPAELCSDIYIGVGNFGGALAFAEYDWSIEDSTGIDILVGQLLLDTLRQVDADTICLPPGNYRLSMNVSNITGGQVFLSISGPPNIWSGIQEPIDFNGNEIDFQLLKNCVNTPNSIVETVRENDFTVLLRERLLMISGNDDRIIETIHIYDSRGKNLLEFSGSESSVQLDLSDLPTGIYILVHRFGDASFSTKLLLN